MAWTGLLSTSQDAWCKDVVILKEFVEKERVFEIFFAGLNNVFDQIWVQILSRENISSLNEIFLLYELTKEDDDVQ